VPYSLSLFDDVSCDFIKHIRIDSCLDVGTGAGKYGKLVRQYHPDARISGVEIDPEYIDQFHLTDIYDDVRCADADGLIDANSEDTFDLVILGDCLEHMRKTRGIDLINFLIYRTNYMLAVYPDHLVQGPWKGHQFESHISVWSNADFAPFEACSLQRVPMSFVAINGFLLRRSDPTVREILSAHLAP
jgi:hypothetical protein